MIREESLKKNSSKAHEDFHDPLQGIKQYLKSHWM